MNCPKGCRRTDDPLPLHRDEPACARRRAHGLQDPSARTAVGGCEVVNRPLPATSCSAAPLRK